MLNVAGELSAEQEVVVRIMMALTDRQTHRHADLGSGFFPVYRS